MIDTDILYCFCSLFLVYLQSCLSHTEHWGWYNKVVIMFCQVKPFNLQGFTLYLQCGRRNAGIRYLSRFCFPLSKSSGYGGLDNRHAGDFQHDCQ